MFETLHSTDDIQYTKLAINMIKGPYSKGTPTQK